MSFIPSLQNLHRSITLRITIKYSHAVYIFIGALQILTHLILIKIPRQLLVLLWSHFVDEETEAQRRFLTSSS